MFRALRNRNYRLFFAGQGTSLIGTWITRIAASWLVYGTVRQPVLLGGLPLPAALYGVLVFPLLWGLTEQMTYNGYLLPRFEVLSRSTTSAVAIVSLVWGRSSLSSVGGAVTCSL